MFNIRTKRPKNGKTKKLKDGKTEKLKNLEILFFCFSVFPFFCSSVFAQARLTVPDNLIGKRTLYLDPQASAPAPCSLFQEGQLYYDSTTTTVRYCDGSTWKNLDLGLSADKTVATRIVAASNSLGTVAGPIYTNPKADLVCDGIADQVEIQAAIDALGVNGGVIYLLEGSYNLSASINLVSEVSLIGTGRATVLRALGAFNLINASNVNGILISQLSLDGNSAGQNGISWDTVTNSKLDNLWIEQMTQDGLRLSSSSDNTILNSRISANGWNGIELLSSSNNNRLSNCIIQTNSQSGIFLNSSQNNNISANHIQANGWAGISLWASSSNSLLANNLQANGTGGSTLPVGIWLGSSSNNTISGNNLQANSTYGLEINWTSNSNNITGNNLNNNNQHGILLAASSSNVISGNLFSNNGGSGAFDGLRIENNANDNIISSNRLRDDLGSGYGIYLQAPTCENNYLVTNLIDGLGYLDTTDRRILDLATNTRYTDKQKLTLERQEVSLGPGGGINGLGQLDVGERPRGYVFFATGSPTPLTSIIDGRAIGDLLILEGPPAGSVTINDGMNVQLGDGVSNHALSAEDTLKLLWNGTDWIELSYSDN